MTEAEFRKIALSFPAAIEKSHVSHPDFRVEGGKIFATLGYPGHGFAVLILTPEQQAELIGRFPDMFEPVQGGWGKRGSTQVILRTASREVVEPAMQIAWANASPNNSKTRASAQPKSAVKKRRRGGV